MVWLLRRLEKVSDLITKTLNQPKKVFVLCLGLLFVTLVMEGSLYRLWSLRTDHHEILERISEIEKSSKELQMKIERIDNPKLLELEARDRFDVVREGDLLFIFSDLQEGGEDQESHGG